MAKLINITGNRYGRLLVLERNKERKGVYWICQCDCGNIVTVQGKHLKSGHTQSCGCLQRERTSLANIDDITGKRFGRLVVLEVDKTKYGNQGQLYWKCKCDCGNIKSILGSCLRKGNTLSCGCLQVDNKIKMREKYSLIGQKIGKLEVLSYADEIQSLEENKRKILHYVCKCDCGNMVIVSSSHLRSGHTQSCGCIKSKGEALIINILKNLNLKYKTQYTFEDLKGETKKLRFDFAIINEDDSIKCLIEYNGQQHYQSVGIFGGEEQFNLQVEYDNKKRQYCKENNIKLIEIPYWDLNKLNSTYVEKIIRGDQSA